MLINSSVKSFLERIVPASVCFNNLIECLLEVYLSKETGLLIFLSPILRYYYIYIGHSSQNEDFHTKYFGTPCAALSLGHGCL